MLAMAAFLTSCSGPGLTERSGLVTLKGQPVTLQGPELAIGHKAPPFTAVANDLSTFDSARLAGGVWIVCSVPSLDTPVCSLETHRFDQAVAKEGGKIHVLTVSMDLPFAQKRWCQAKSATTVQTVSDYRDRTFGRAYGVYMKETGLLARAIFVINRQGVLRHVQIVPEVADEPDYDAALAAAREAAKSP
jgi:thiol peroxidase